MTSFKSFMSLTIDVERRFALTTRLIGQAGLGASKQGISQPLQSTPAGGGMGVIDMHQADKKR